MTKPVDAKYGGKKSIVSSSDEIKLNVETTDVSNEASQPVETRNQCVETKTIMFIPYGAKFA